MRSDAPKIAMRQPAATHEERLKALRMELALRKLSGFVVPVTDEHLSEYIGAYARRLAWLTGFQGSTAFAVVLQDKAAIFVDGRYTIQVRQQVDERLWSYESLPQTSVVAWLGEHSPNGTRIGYDPWLHTKNWVIAVRASLAEKNADLVAVATNPVDVIWPDQPPPSTAKLLVHPDDYAGRASADKRRAIAQWLAEKKADAVVLSALDSVAWTFNLRGQDVDHTPVALAFALVYADGCADLFVAPEKLTASVVEHLGRHVRSHSREMFVKHLGTLAGRTIAVDPQRTVVAILEVLEASGAQVIEARDPVILPKAIKSIAEIAGHKTAQVHDGVALTRFLHWLSIEAPKGILTELSAAARLREFREMSSELRDLSCRTISGFGPNGAIVHYRANEATSRTIVPGSLYLVDSGGQYVNGTTDVTRTVAIGTPSSEMRDRFTRTLKGHIALARAVFPVGTMGSQLDTLARQYLWDAGLDYAHGTGHGIGAYLAIHEGPQRIAHTLDSNEPLVPGMIISNEPGYYKAGDYGIRIENLILVVKREISGADREMLGFEMLSFAPIDRALIEVGLLTREERAWIDSYHTDVARIVGAQLDGAAKIWLAEATRAMD